MKDLVSIVMPLYNTEKFICETIKSVISQTYQNWELIMVDDCSTDNTVNLVEKYVQSDSRIKLHKLDVNSGAAICRNRSIKLAEGRFIAFLDSDDLWKENKLDIQLKFMKENDIAFSYANYDKIDEASNFLNSTVTSPKMLTYKKLLKANFIGCLTVIYDASKLGKVYFPDIRKRQDFALWLKIFKTGVTGYNCNENLGLYRVREGSISSNKIEMIKKNYILYNQVLKFNPIKSMYYVLNNVFIKLFIKK